MLRIKLWAVTNSGSPPKIVLRDALVSSPASGSVERTLVFQSTTKVGTINVRGQVVRTLAVTKTGSGIVLVQGTVSRILSWSINRVLTGIVLVLSNDSKAKKIVYWNRRRRR